jgi:hypothetical protein
MRLLPRLRARDLVPHLGLTSLEEGTHANHWPRLRRW